MSTIIERFNCLRGIICSRRAVRSFSEEAVPDSVIRESLHLSLLAPNSCNLNLWEFYWIKNHSIKNKVIEACLFQLPIRSASQLIVAVSRPDLWKERNSLFLKELETNNSVMSCTMEKFQRNFVPKYYDSGKLGIKGLIRDCISSFKGIFHPVMRGCFSGKMVLALTGIKSTAMACENFLLAVEAFGYHSCPIEGFDSKRIKKALSLPNGAYPVMVIAVGKKSIHEIEWPRTRINQRHTIKEIF